MDRGTVTENFKSKSREPYGVLFPPASLIYDKGGNYEGYDSRDFDLKFSVTVPRATDQTDFEAPELDLTSFISLDEIV